MTAWFVAAWSTVLTAVLGGLALALPELPHDLGEVVAACTHALPHHGEAISATSVRAGGLVLAAAIAGRASWCVVATQVTGFRLRRRRREAVRIVGRATVRPDAVVLESDLAWSTACLAVASRSC